MRWILSLFLIVALAGLGWAIVRRLDSVESQLPTTRPAIAAVEVADIARGPIALRRVYSGTLEARAEFVVAPKVGGRIVRLHVDLADRVRRGQLVAELDDDEYAQAVAQAEADRAVARATVVEAEKALEFSERERDRLQSLVDRGVASETELDTARADHLTRVAAVEVAKARVQRADAALATAKIRLGYTRVAADWTDSDTERVISERTIDAGQVVTANTPLMTIVDLDPILGVVHVTEKDYARLEVGQPVKLTTDAHPGRVFAGEVRRIAPVFRPTSRQARVELMIENPDHDLKPGMFIRAEVTLESIDEATLVPIEALVTRGDSQGVFLLADDGESVEWRPVTVGIREGDLVQLLEEGLRGRVVSLGQQLIEDGSEVTIPGADPAEESGALRGAGDGSAARERKA